MEKTEFKFQYYVRQWICALPCLVIAILSIVFLLKWIKQELLVYIIAAIVLIALLKLYFSFMKKYGWFTGEGYFWMENQVLYIQRGKKKMPIDSVKELFGTVLDVYSNRCASIMVDTGKKKYKLYSIQLDKGMRLEDSSIYEIYQLILNEFELQPVEMRGEPVENWYRGV